jgi:hypothetical protein
MRPYRDFTIPFVMGSEILVMEGEIHQMLLTGKFCPQRATQGNFASEAHINCIYDRARENVRESFRVSLDLRYR